MTDQQKKLDNLPANKASAEELKKARERIAIKDPDHLKRWLIQTRPFIVFDSNDMANAIGPLWPESARMLQQVVNLYRSHRLTLQTGDFTTVVDPVSKKEIQQPTFKDDVLTDVELDRCIRWLVGQMLDKDPKWTLESTPL